MDGVTVRVAADPAEMDAAGQIVADAYFSDGFHEEGYRARLLDGQSRAREATLLVAVDDATGELLGTVTYTVPGEPWAEVSGPREGEFRMLGVAPSAQGRGVGRLLVEACVERARREGRHGVAISTEVSMAAAHRLYERLGFARAPELDWAPNPDVSLLGYRLAIDPGPTFQVRVAASPAEVAAAGEVGAAAYAGHAFGTKRYRAHMADAADRARQAELLVAVDDDGTVLGTVTYALGGTPYAEVARPGEAEFRMLGVRAEAAGRGVGEALARACVDRARRDGASAVAISTLEVMTAARRIYHRLGFRHVPERDWRPIPQLLALGYVLRLDES